MGRERSGARGRARGEGQNGVPVVRTLGVVRQSGIVVAALATQLRQDIAVDRPAAMCRHLLFDRQPDDLVPESQGRTVTGEDAGGHELVQHVQRRAWDRGQERGVDAHAVQRGGVDRAAGVGGEVRDAGGHRVTRGEREFAVVGAQYLGDEERVPAGEAVEVGRQPVAALRASVATASADNGPTSTRRVER